MSLRALLLLVVSVFLPFSSVSAEAVTLVLYPDVRPPYDKVFDDISSGFADKFDGALAYLKVSGETSSGTVAETVESVKPQLVLALGKSSYSLYRESAISLPIVLGATTDSEQLVAGISMIPDSTVIMQYMLKLAPNVKRVYVVKRNDQLNEMVEQASQFLDSRQIQLVSMETASLKESAEAYRQILAEANEGEAIWILPGSGVVDNSVLSMILREAWRKNLALFSSNPTHVKMGLLFAAYPDNYGLGASLAELAGKILSGEAENKMLPLRDLHLAVNERTSRHLGIELTVDIKEEIDLLLPAR